MTRCDNDNRSGGSPTDTAPVHAVRDGDGVGTSITRRDAADTSRVAALQPLLLRLSEVAKLLSVSERQVWTLIRSKALPVVRPPSMRVIRVAREDVEALVAAWRSESRS